MNVLNTEQRQFIVALYRDGEQTQAAIADLVGTTQSNVSKVLAQARRRDPGVPLRRAKENIAACPPRQRMFAASQLGRAGTRFDLDRF